MSLQIFGKEVISYNSTEKNDVLNKLHSFTFEPQKWGGAESNSSCDQALRPKEGFFTLLQKEEI